MDTDPIPRVPAAVVFLQRFVRPVLPLPDECSSRKFQIGGIMPQRILIIVIAVLLCPAGGAAQTLLLRSAMGGGGVQASGVTITLRGTIGQPVGGEIAGSTHSMGIGFWYQAGLGTDDVGEALPETEALVLGQNYPNPFGPGSASCATSTQWEFHIASGGHTEFAVYDLMGQRKAVLVNEWLDAGRYIAVLRAADLPAGFYLCRLVQGTQHSERRLLLLR